MARGGRVIYKKPNRRKRRFDGDDDDDEDDEEYVAGEDAEESESNYESDVNSRDLSDEGGAEFSDELESEDGDEDEDEEFTTSRSKKRSRGIRRKSRVIVDGIGDLPPAKRNRGRGRPRKQRLGSSDEDEDDEDFSPDEEDFDEDEMMGASVKRGRVKNNGKKRKSAVRKTSKGRKRLKRTSVVAPPPRKRQQRVIESSDDDFVVKDRVSIQQKRSRSRSVKEERDLEYLDSDFVTSDDDFVKEDVGLICNGGKNSKKVTGIGGSKQGRRKRLVEGSDSSDSDFVVSEEEDEEDEEVDIDVKGQVRLARRKKKSKKQKVERSNMKRGQRSRLSVVTESDSDYLVSEEEEEEEEMMMEEEEEDEFDLMDQIVVDEERLRGNKTVVRRNEPHTARRRKGSLVDSESDSFDFDDVISDEEVRDLAIGGSLIPMLPERVVAEKKAEEKGKGKQDDDSGKQVCGICLSEGKKSIIQGLLNCCTHYFCFACIMEWSKVESRCPVCKRRFGTITKSGRSDPGFGMRNAVIRVQKRDQVYQPSEEELRGMLDPYENVVCMECQQGGDDNLMLLCDICDSSAHTYCVGLGRDVPEGNWYCECCRSVNDGLYYSQFQDTTSDQRSSITNLCPGITERGGSTISPRPVSVSGRSSSLRIDLNALPRDFSGDDHVSSPISGSGASTVSGRRHIRQRIHIILSSNRLRRSLGTSTLHPNSSADVQMLQEALPTQVLSDEQQNHRPSLYTLSPCTFNNGSGSRHVDGAKDEVHDMVRSHLKNLPQSQILERSTLKQIAKSSTHTVLAACGIEHDRRLVSAAVQPPANCPHHAEIRLAHLWEGCCSSCFSSFVQDIVQRLADTRS